MRYTEKQLAEARKEAPEDIQGLLDDPDFGAIVFMFATNEHIDDDKALDIEDAVVHTLLGLEPLADLKQTIQKMGVLPMAAEKVVGELDRNIFTNIRASLNSMQKTHTSPQIERVEKETPQAVLPPLAKPTIPPLQPKEKNPLEGLIAPGKVVATPQNLPVAPAATIQITKPTTPRHIFEKALQKQTVGQTLAAPKPTPPATKPVTPPTPAKTHPASKAPYPKDFNKPPEHVDQYREQV